MIFIKKNLFLTVLFLLASCGSDGPYEDYIGIWVADSIVPVALEIKASGEGLVFQELITKGRVQEKELSTEIFIKPDGLFIRDRRTDIKLNLSEDKEILTITGIDLYRISKSDYKKIKEELSQ